MERYTLQQRIEIIKIHYKNGEKLAVTVRKTKELFGPRGSPSRTAIQKMVDKFELLGQVSDVKNTTRARRSRTTENIAAVAQSVKENPYWSIPRRSLELGIPQTSLHRILHKDLGIKAHKVQLTEELEPADHEQRRVLEMHENDPELTCTKMAGERPKRPLSAYMLWLNENREQMKKDNPGSKDTDIAKRGGELWRAMKDKTEWEQKASRMKEDYNKAVKEYEANGGTDTGASKKRKVVKAVKPAKKAKKKDTSEEEDEGESE